MKKLLAYILITSILWASVILPARAFLPLAGIAYVMELAAGLTVAEQVSLGVSVAIHAAILSISLTSDGNAPTADKSNVPIEVHIDPNTPLIKPASATATSIPATQSTDTFPTIYSFQGSNANGYCEPTMMPSGFTYPDGYSAAEYASSLCSDNYPNRSICGPNGVGNYSVMSQANCTGAVVGGTTISETQCPSGYTKNADNKCEGILYTCPSGYTLNGQSCTPNDSNTQSADGKKQILRDAVTGFQEDPHDPDTLPNNVQVTPSSVKIDNGDVHDDIVIEQNGTVSYYHYETKSDGTTQQQKVKISAPSGTEPGTTKVEGTEVSTYSGSGAGVGGPDGTAAASTNVNITGGSVSLDKAGLAKDSQQCGYDAAHPCHISADPGTSPSTSIDGTGAIETQIDDALLANRGWIDTIRDHAADGLSWSWLPDIPSSSCTSTDITAGGHTISLDICSIAVKIRDVVAYVFYVLTAFGLHRILTTPMGRSQ